MRNSSIVYFTTLRWAIKLHFRLKLKETNWKPKIPLGLVKINVVNNQLKFYICSPNDEPLCLI